jgi:PAS domain S-box-containing protein
VRIKTQFILAVVLGGIIAILVATSVIISNRQVAQINGQETAAVNIQQEANDLSYLANDYLLYQESQQLARWESKFASLSTDLAKLNPGVPEQQNLANNLKADQMRLQSVFNEVKSTLESSPAADATTNLAFIRVSWSRIEVQSQGIVSEASRLTQMLDAQANQVERANIILIVALIGIFFIFFIANYLFVNQRLLKSISFLRNSTRIIGSGKLDHFIPEKGKDEIGELSHAFNLMTASLKTVTASKTDLEKEVEERKRIQAELESVSMQSKLALDAARMGWWHFDPIRNYSWWDERYKEIFGFAEYEKPNEEILASRIYPEDLPGVRSKVQSALDPLNPQSYAAEYRINLPDGSVKWIEAYGITTFEGTGKDKHATSLVGTVTDITERKKAEEALQQSEEKYRSLNFSMNEGVGLHEIIYDDKGQPIDYRILDVNPAYEKITGLSKDRAIGAKASELYGTGRAPYFDVYERVASTGKPESFETYFPPMQKSFSISVFSPARGRFATVFADITARKKAEEDIQNTLNRFYAVLNGIPLGILLVTADGLGEFANQTFCGMFNLKESPASLKNRSSAEIIQLIQNNYLYPENAVIRIAEMVEKLEPIKDEEIPMTEGRTFLRDFVPVRLGEKAYGRLWIHRDITDRKKTEEALQLRQAEIQTLFENIPAGLVLFHGARPYKVLVQNRYYQELFAEPFKSHGMAGLNVFQYAPEVEASGVVAVFDEVVRTKQPKSFLDFPYNANPLKESWFNWYIAPIVINDKVVALVSMSLDVTDRHIAEQALKESEERFRAIAETSLVQISVSRISDGSILFVNHAHSDAFGYRPEELIGRKGIDLYADSADRARLIQSLTEKGFVKGYEVRVKRADGTPFWLSTSVRNVDYAGEPAYLAASIDITERRKAEETLRETRDYLDNLFNYANAPIIVWNPDFEITRFNHAFEHLTGRTGDEVMGKKLDILFPDNSREETLDFIRKTPVGERWDVVEIPILHRDGTVRVVLWNSATVYAPDGKTAVATIAQGQDITARKKAEEELKRSIAELEVSNKELEAFSYSVSHDLRAPLRSMEGFSSALLEDYGDKLGPQGKQYLIYVQESSDLMGRIIDDLLRLSRVTRSEMTYEKVNLSEMAEKILSELQKTEPDRKVTLDISPDVMAYGDRNLLRLALENLIGNAWKFSGKTDSPRIEVGTVEHNGKQAYFVRDNGVGFDMAYANKLFKPFQRLHKASEFPGTGIGLATIQRIIRRHGGEVWAESKLGEGTTFYFTLSQE